MGRNSETTLLRSVTIADRAHECSGENCPCKWKGSSETAFGAIANNLAVLHRRLAITNGLYSIYLIMMAVLTHIYGRIEPDSKFAEGWVSYVITSVFLLSEIFLNSFKCLVTQLFVQRPMVETMAGGDKFVKRDESGGGYLLGDVSVPVVFYSFKVFIILFYVAKFLWDLTTFFILFVFSTTGQEAVLDGALTGWEIFLLVIFIAKPIVTAIAATVAIYIIVILFRQGARINRASAWKEIADGRMDGLTLSTLLDFNWLLGVVYNIGREKAGMERELLGSADEGKV